MGASPYGVMDMVGNVREWVADWYGSGYYAISHPSNPPGPESNPDCTLLGACRVTRGGDWPHEVSARVADRDYSYIGVIDDHLGFRCAKSVIE